MEKIDHTSYPTPSDAKFSLIIPTWNNLDYLKLCIDSIKKNSHFSHQIILHVNEGIDGSLEWAKENKLEHTYSKKNIGICYAVNAAASMAEKDYIVYINDDNYVCPDWDLFLWDEIQKMDHHYFLLASTLIEPRDTNNPCVITAPEFGDGIENFKEDLLLEKFQQFPMNDSSGGGGTSDIVHRSLWNLVGGYSIEFSPGMYSDPDLLMKLWQVGVRIFKCVSKSRAYHFQCKSTGRILQLNDGRKQFRKKWKIPSSRFTQSYLRLGQDYKGPLETPKEDLAMKIDRLRGNFY